MVKLYCVELGSIVFPDLVGVLTAAAVEMAHQRPRAEEHRRHAVTNIFPACIRAQPQHAFLDLGVNSNLAEMQTLAVMENEKANDRVGRYEEHRSQEGSCLHQIIGSPGLSSQGRGCNERGAPHHLYILHQRKSIVGRNV